MTQTSVLKTLGNRVLADEEIRKKAGYAAAGLTTANTTSTNLINNFEKMKNLNKIAEITTISKKLKTLKLKDATGKNVMYYYNLASKL